MRLLFVFTGGTIGSTKTDAGIIGIDPSKPYLLLKLYEERYGIDFSYDTAEPLDILSENHSGETIAAVVHTVKDGSKKGYDGIIVTHGSDTLQYMAAALGYSFGNDALPICLVASNRPITERESNGPENLQAAVEWIRGGFGRGVVTCYRNPGERGITVHRACRMIAGRAYSDHCNSVQDGVIGWMSGRSAAEHVRSGARNIGRGRAQMPVFAENALFRELKDETAVLDAEKLRENSERVCRIVPYPGMCYPEIPDGVTDILHESYHSGTIRTQGEGAERFFRQMKERGIRVWLSGAGEDTVYESTEKYADYGIRVLPKLSPVAAYMKLWLLSESERETEKEMYRSLGGDRIV